MNTRLSGFAAALLAILLFATVASAEHAQMLGPGKGTLIGNSQQDSPCGFGNLLMNGNESYENAYAWNGGGVQPPDWGAFAECFDAGSGWEICGFVFDLTTSGHTPYYTGDAYLWADQNGIPGNVIAVVTGFDPNPVAEWPDIERFTVPVLQPVNGRIWAGEWGNWPGYENYLGWYIAADLDGAPGCPFTHVLPGVGYPSGWQNTSVIWGPTQALGIGLYGHMPPTSGTPIPGEVATWGQVKSLYR